MAYPDDFNRANGGLGAGWSVIQGSAAIVSKKAVIQPTSRVLAAGQAETGLQDHYLIAQVSSSSIGSPTLLLCYNTSTKSGLQFSYDYNGTRVRCTLTSLYDGGGVGLGYWDATVGAQTQITCRATANAGLLNIYVNDIHILTDAGGFPDQGDSFGMGTLTSEATVLSFDTVPAGPPYLTISPSTAWFASPLLWFTATLHNDTWNPETYPHVGLSVDKGFIPSQKVDTTTMGEFSYLALGNQGVVTVTDSVTGAQGTFTLTLYPVDEPGVDFPITKRGSDILDRTGAACPAGTMLTTCTTIDYNGGPKLGEALDAILWTLGGYQGQTVPDFGQHNYYADIEQIRLALNGNLTLDPEEVNPGYPESLGAMLGELHDFITKPDLVSRYTVDEVLGILGGTPTLYSHADIMAALGNISPTDLSDVIDAIHAAQGTGLPTISDVMVGINGLGTSLGGDLADIKDAVGKLGPTDLSAVLEKLDLIQPATAISLSTVATSAGTAATAATAVDVAVGLLTGGGTLTLATVMEALGVITDLLNALKSGSAGPLWPGLENVTLGASHALVNGLVVNGPLHGLLFTITGQPEHNQRYLFGTVNSWSRVGAAIFTTDRGDSERSQSFALDTQILVPTTMEQAASATVRLNSGWQGTVRAWSKA